MGTSSTVPTLKIWFTKPNCCHLWPQLLWQTLSEMSCSCCSETNYSSLKQCWVSECCRLKGTQRAPRTKGAQCRRIVFERKRPLSFLHTSDSFASLPVNILSSPPAAICHEGIWAHITSSLNHPLPSLSCHLSSATTSFTSVSLLHSETWQAWWISREQVILYNSYDWLYISYRAWVGKNEEKKNALKYFFSCYVKKCKCNTCAGGFSLYGFDLFGLTWYGGSEKTHRANKAYEAALPSQEGHERSLLYCDLWSVWKRPLSVLQEYCDIYCFFTFLPRGRWEVETIFVLFMYNGKAFI